MSDAAQRIGNRTDAPAGCSGGGPATFETDLALPGARRGKVRDTYLLPAEDGLGERVVMIATDRISAFDVVMPTAIPGKGRLLTAIAAFWLRWIAERGLSETHLISTDADHLPSSAFGGSTTREDVRGRVTIGRACRVVPIECVVRGALEGSGWVEYCQSGTVCGVSLPAGLERCAMLAEPIFTPATKAESGHDENISFDEAARQVGGPLMETLRTRSVAIYRAAAAHAAERGIILADTKFEFGVPVENAGDGFEGEPILIDEALTPDSSRFWPADTYKPGSPQPSFDKQFVREYLQGLVDRGVWDKTPPGPALPDDVVNGTLARYEEACRRLTS